ncbi:cell wall-binding repeat-containing protein [Agromyces sp. ZXT2-3]|uniref:cell wall-binding repeat-containing protein n=1 Tax=Agromyces sp. ZXT2-3 TaxID=3461152 RepID=UPI004055363D
MPGTRIAVGAVITLALIAAASVPDLAAGPGPPSPSGSPVAADAAAREPPGRPDDPPRRRGPPEIPSTVLEQVAAPTSRDRSLASGLQDAPPGNRIVGSVVAAGGSDVVPESVLSTVASVTDRSPGRAGGADRYLTSVALSQHVERGGSDVWLATGENFPDGLAASAVAGARGGPVLLTRSTQLPSSVAAELAALAPDRVWVMGGAAAVSEPVLDSIREILPDSGVARIAGVDRFGTAAALVGEFFASAGAVFAATGANFPDALAAGPAAALAEAPTLLVTRTSVPPASETQLRRLRPPVVHVVGGPDVIGDAVVERIAELTGGVVERVAGEDRYATAAAVADRFFTATTPSLLLATGSTFADSIGAGAVAGSRRSPLLLITPTAAPRATIDAARRISWWLPETGRVLRYTLVAHPDDEFAAWSVSGVRDQGRYDVFVVLTKGESSRFCDGEPVDDPWMSEQFLPQPQPTGVQYSERCKQHRMDSWRVFVHGAGLGQVDETERLTAGPVEFDGREVPVPLSRDEAGTVVVADGFEVAVGSDAAVVTFDLGALTVDEVLWAVQTARGLADRFPTQVEGDVIGAGFFNDGSSGYVNVHADHRAVHELLGGTDLGMPGSQYATVGHAQSARAFGSAVTDYCGHMCHPAAPFPLSTRMGGFQYAYGWLADGYWPPDDVDSPSGFSRYQSFAKWYRTTGSRTPRRTTRSGAAR